MGWDKFKATGRRVGTADRLGNANPVARQQGSEPGPLPVAGLFSRAGRLRDSVNVQGGHWAARYIETPHAQHQIADFLQTADAISKGKKPQGHCYAAVWKMIEKSGYGKMPAANVPDAYSTYAYQFADYANSHLSELGLVKLPIANPYDAPPGALVVVRAGAPGTANPRAGDISVAMGHGRFLNDGEMSYGGSKKFPPGNNYVLGVYLPR